jgi:hypothetical protein
MEKQARYRIVKSYHSIAPNRGFWASYDRMIEVHLLAPMLQCKADRVGEFGYVMLH